MLENLVELRKDTLTTSEVASLTFITFSVSSQLYLTPLRNDEHSRYFQRKAFIQPFETGPKRAIIYRVILGFRILQIIAYTIQAENCNTY